MTFRDYVVVMSLATAAAWVAFLIVLVSTDPAHAGWLGLALFYLTFGLSVVGTLSVAGTAVRAWARPQELVSRHASRAFRQAILVAVLVVACLLLLAAGWFRSWTGILLVVAAALVELAFLASQSRARPAR